MQLMETNINKDDDEIDRNNLDLRVFLTNKI